MTASWQTWTTIRTRPTTRETAQHYYRGGILETHMGGKFIIWPCRPSSKKVTACPLYSTAFLWLLSPNAIGYNLRIRIVGVWDRRRVVKQLVICLLDTGSMLEKSHNLHLAHPSAMKSDTQKASRKFWSSGWIRTSSSWRLWTLVDLVSSRWVLDDSKLTMQVMLFHMHNTKLVTEIQSLPQLEVDKSSGDSNALSCAVVILDHISISGMINENSWVTFTKSNKIFPSSSYQPVRMIPLDVWTSWVRSYDNVSPLEVVFS